VANAPSNGKPCDNDDRNAQNKHHWQVMQGKQVMRQRRYVIQIVVCECGYRRSKKNHSK
jgi:hypothetical protein